MPLKSFIGHGARYNCAYLARRVLQRLRITKVCTSDRRTQPAPRAALAAAPTRRTHGSCCHTHDGTLQAAPPSHTPLCRCDRRINGGRERQRAREGGVSARRLMQTSLVWSALSALSAVTEGRRGKRRGKGEGGCSRTIARAFEVRTGLIRAQHPSPRSPRTTHWEEISTRSEVNPDRVVAQHCPQPLRTGAHPYTSLEGFTGRATASGARMARWSGLRRALMNHPYRKRRWASVASSSLRVPCHYEASLSSLACTESRDVDDLADDRSPPQ